MTDANYVVRVCGPAEAESAAQLLHDFNVEFDCPTPPVAELAERIRTLVTRPDFKILLAGEPAVAVAVTTFRPSLWSPGPVALLEELYVRPELRSRGIGAAVLTRAIAAAKERGVTTFEINVDEGDVDAQRFYRSHGFTEIEYPETGERAFYFHREI
ncbi:GNAT family N-acetyltransferase [Sporichthya brevicatena]|uniref:GNAT family N-acetyltransferase n=1 Tax=Sporichthya brevicatena TaxID=171442 RepID=A0ABN1H504_9ACTN